jgi:hypothetical protein
MLPSHHFAWARLNADTLFLGLLAGFAGFFAIIDPSDDPVMRIYNYVGPLHYVRASAYMLSGALLTVALARGAIHYEFMARSILAGAITLNVYRHAIWLGWGDADTLANVVLLLIITLTSWFRLSILLRPGGMTINRADDPPAREGR